MKTLKIFSSLMIGCLIATVSFAQKSTTVTFKVSGECGMCKSKIEKAAKQAGATYAVWSVSKKEVTVKYNSNSTNKAKIQESIANAGYDTPGFKAAEDAYNKLDDCCKYERNTAAAASCDSGMDCCKDGTCAKSADGKDCCKKS